LDPGRLAIGSQTVDRGRWITPKSSEQIDTVTGACNQLRGGESKVVKLGSIASALIVLLLVVAAVACGGASPSNTSGKSAAKIDWGPYCDASCQQALTLKASQESVNCRVAFLDDATSFSYGAAQFQRTKQDAAKYFPNMQLTVLNGNNDPSTQSSQLDTVVSQGIKVVILDPVVKDALAPATKRAVDKGVKVIAIDRTVSTPVLTTIKAPDVPLGERATQRIVDQLHGSGNVAILSGTPGASPTIDRTNGFMSVVKTSPGIHVVANASGNYDTNQGYTATKDLLSRFPSGKLDWIYSEADNMSFGAIKAVQESNRANDVKITGIDGQNQAMDAVMAGTYDGTVVYPLVEPMSLAAAAKACQGESMPQSISLLYPLVTRENVATYRDTNFS
jgi:ribose transport system substrate-binding protein